MYSSQAGFKNPVYQPVETPTNTMKYSNIFNSLTPQQSHMKIEDHVVVTATDEILDERASADFGKHSRHVSQQSAPDFGIPSSVKRTEYIACNLM